MSRDGRPGPIRGVVTGAIVGGLESLRAGWAMRSHSWWRHAPFLPLPDERYLQWRTSTAYGNTGAPLETRDIRSFLRWRADFRRYLKAGGHQGMEALR